MPTGQLRRVIFHLRQAVARADGGSLSDAQLLDGFLLRHDADAFALLVRRHGPMVLGVCRRVLGNEADAEDAFQATFLVLVRKAAAVVPRAQVGNWLYGVAVNTARKAKAMIHNRRIKERQAATQARSEEATDNWQQWQALLDEELSRLPDKYRIPIVLCDLEGKAIKEAARQLGWPQGTVASRLSRGRALLAQRLQRGGLLLSGGALAAFLSERAATAAVPGSLVSSTVEAASVFAAGSAAAGGVSASVVALTEGVLKAMLMTKLKIAMGLIAVAVTLGVGAAGVGYQVRADEGGASPPEPTRPLKPAIQPAQGQSAYSVPAPMVTQVPSAGNALPPMTTPAPANYQRDPFGAGQPKTPDNAPREQGSRGGIGNFGPTPEANNPYGFVPQSGAVMGAVRDTERDTIEQLRKALREGEPQTATLPVGRWHLEFSNGEKTICEIGKNGIAVRGDKKIDGRAAVKGGVTIIVFRDEQILRWTPVGQKMVVEHWANSTHYQSIRPTLGIAERSGGAAQAPPAGPYISPPGGTTPRLPTGPATETSPVPAPVPANKGQPDAAPRTSGFPMFKPPTAPAPEASGDKPQIQGF
jgi:RNA polymerase sigma factor (sigma-70 family)